MSALTLIVAAAALQPPLTARLRCNALRAEPGGPADVGRPTMEAGCEPVTAAMAATAAGGGGGGVGAIAGTGTGGGGREDGAKTMIFGSVE